MKKILVFAMIILLLIVSTGLSSLKIVKAAICVKQWSYTDSQSGLQYTCYEYNDASFKVVENYYGAIRTITGRAYLDENGYPRAAVDQITSSYWDQVMSSANARYRIEGVFALANLFMSPYVVSGDWIIYKSFAWLFVNDIIASNIDRMSYDIVKVAFEAGCASQCAIDLAHTPGIILPSLVTYNG